MTFTQTDINVPVDGTITSAKLSGDLTLPGHLTLGAGKNISNASGNLTIDVAGTLVLDADGAILEFQDGGTSIGTIESGSQNLNIKTAIADKDIRLQGFDGDLSTLITAVNFDMSEAGQAAFNAGATFGSGVSVTGAGYFGPIGTGNATTAAEMDTYHVLKLKPHNSNSTNMTFAQVDGGASIGIQVSNGSQNAAWDIALNPFNGGLVGIGTPSPASGLDITGSDNTKAKLTLTNTAPDPDNTWSIHPVYNSQDLVFADGGTEEFRMLGGGGLTFNGDTAAANALDDYEEGTWTVAEVNGQGGTVTTNRANYTKIGRMVFASASVTVGTTTNANTLNFSLPFASSINGYYLGGGNVSYHEFPAAQSDNLRPNIENAAADVHFLYGDNATHALSVKCNQVSTKRIDFFVQYQI